MMTTNEFGDVAVEEAPNTNEFGDTPVSVSSKPSKNEFGDEPFSEPGIISKAANFALKPLLTIPKVDPKTGIDEITGQPFHLSVFGGGLSNLLPKDYQTVAENKAREFGDAVTSPVGLIMAGLGPVASITSKAFPIVSKAAQIAASATGIGFGGHAVVQEGSNLANATTGPQRLGAGLGLGFGSMVLAGGGLGMKDALTTGAKPTEITSSEPPATSGPEPTAKTTSQPTQSVGAAMPSEMLAKNVSAGYDVLQRTGPIREKWKQAMVDEYPSTFEDDPLALEQLYNHVQDAANLVDATGGKMSIADASEAITGRAQQAVTEGEVGVKKESINAQRSALGMPEIVKKATVHEQEVWNEATRQIQDDPQAIFELINHLKKNPKATINDVQAAMLDHATVTETNKLRQAMKDVNDAAKSGDEPTRIAAESVMRTSQERLNDIHQVAREAGRQWGLSGRMAQHLVNENYEFQNLVQRWMAEKGGKNLTTSELTEAQRIADKHAKNVAEVAKSETEAQKSGEAATGKAAVESLNQQAKRESGGRKLTVEQEAYLHQRALERLSDSESPEVTGHWLRKISLGFVRNGIKELTPLVDAVHDAVKGVLPDMTKTELRDALCGYGKWKKLTTDQAKLRHSELMAQALKLAQLEAATGGKPPLKTGFERIPMSDTVRSLVKQVKAKMAEMGIVATDPAKQLATALKAAKTRLTNSIADIERQLVTGERDPKRSGVQYDAEAKALRERADDMRRVLRDIDGKPELTDAQRIKMTTEALERNLAENVRRIKDHDLAPKPKGSKTPDAPEIRRLREMNEETRKFIQQLRDIDNPKASPEEAAAARYKTVLQKNIAEYQRRIAENDFTPRSKPQIVRDEATIKLKAEQVRIREQFQELMRQEQLKNRSGMERGADWLAMVNRNIIKLSGIKTLGKLAAYALFKIPREGVEAAVGRVLQSVPGVRDVMSRAGLEGSNTFQNVKTYGKAFFGPGMKDAYQTLRKGGSDFYVSHGGDMQTKANQFFIRLHQTIKSPVLRAAYEMADAKMVDHAVRNGIDPNAPAVRQARSLAAFSYGLDSILLGNNRFAAAIRRNISEIERPNKTTGRVSFGAKTAALLAKSVFTIVRVPSNYFLQSVQAIAGAPWALGKIASLPFRNGNFVEILKGEKSLTKAFQEGVAKMPEAEANLVARALKRGMIVTALGLYGYYNRDEIGGYDWYNKQGDKPKTYKIRLAGVEIPSYLLHSPPFEVIQFFATIGHLMDYYEKKGHTDGTDYVTSMAKSMLQATMGLTERAPIVNEATRMTSVLEPSGRSSRAMGEFIKSNIIPVGLQDIAKMGDEEGYTPKPKTVLHNIMTGLPYYRQEVPGIYR